MRRNLKYEHIACYEFQRRHESVMENLSGQFKKLQTKKKNKSYMKKDLKLFFLSEKYRHKLICTLNKLIIH